MSLQVEYVFLNADSDEITEADLPQIEPGQASATLELRITRTLSSVDPETALLMGATLFNRSVDDGDAADGYEVITESWLEISTDGETWEPISPGPSVDISSWFSSSPETVAFYLRVNAPASPSTTGDFKATLEIFAR